MPKKFVILGGLPRSGSTLLANLLAQNPKFHTTATSGVLEILFTMRNRFLEMQQFQAMDSNLLDLRIKNAMTGALNGFYGDIEKPVVFEKARGWEGHLELAQTVFGERPKLICCVRNLMDVLASFEKLDRAAAATRQTPDRKNFPFKTMTLEGRLNLWLANDGGQVGVPVNMIRDAVNRGFRDCIYFCEYEKLTSQPSRVIKEIYDHLGEDEFKHDYNNVEQVTFENDLVYVYPNLHKIRTKIEPQESTWPKIIPEAVAAPYLRDARFWTSL